MNACIRLIVVGDLLMANSSEVFKSSQVLNLSQHMMRALSSFPLPEESSAARPFGEMILFSFQFSISIHPNYVTLASPGLHSPSPPGLH
uniref:Uncharacterized protein n=1 Tax=Salix viminalis TaxID=40686 RepID=A0A6N2MBH0_SALVM